VLDLKRTDSKDPDFIVLVQELDSFLSRMNGEEDAIYSQYNKIDALKQVVVAYLDGCPAGCGAIKLLEPGTGEVKRMYTIPKLRSRGVASAILKELEGWARETGCVRCVLETGTMLPDAVKLYQSRGYMQIPNYGQYQGMERSICFEKRLSN